MKLVKQTMVYQPIVAHPLNGVPSIVGFEALWQPRHGSPPEAFRVQRQNGTLTLADLSCIDSAWKGRPALNLQKKLHINVFPATLETQDFWQWLNRLPANVPITRDLVELPWTETTLERLECLRSRGFSIALDDIGQHVGTWKALKEFTPDIIKLDARVTRPTRRNEHILKSVVAYIKTRSVSLVGEGIESQQQLSWLQSLGIDNFQGFYYHHPAPVTPGEPFIMDDELSVSKRTDIL